MEIIEFLNNHSYKKTETKISFVLLCLSYLAIHIYDYIKCKKINLTLIIVQAIMILIIYLFIYFTSKLYIRFTNLKTAFSFKDYNEKYNEFENLIFLFKKRNLVKKIGFLLLWVAIITFYIVSFYNLGIIPANYMGNYTVGIYILTVIFNGISYFLCFSYIMLLRKISNSEMKKQYPHNKYLPCNTHVCARLASIPIL